MSPLIGVFTFADDSLPVIAIKLTGHLPSLVAYRAHLSSDEFEEMTLWMKKDASSIDLPFTDRLRH